MCNLDLDHDIVDIETVLHDVPNIIIDVSLLNYYLKKSFTLENTSTKY